MATAVVPSGAGEGSALPPPPAPPAETEASPTPAPVKAKPIKEPRSKIPGVIDRTDAGKELFRGVGRDEKGKFAKLFGQNTEDRLGSFEDEGEAGADDRETSSPDVPDVHEGMPGEVAPEKPAVKVEAKPGEAVVKPGEAPKPEAKPKIKFADKEYDDLTSAEQEVRTLRGMFKPLNERAQAYDSLKSQQAEDRQAALEWTNIARQLLAGALSDEDAGKLRQQLGIGAGTGVGNTPSSNGKAGLPSPEEIVKSLDLQMFEDLALHPQGGLKLAGEHLAEQILTVVAEKILPNLKQEFQTTLQPVVADREMQARTASLDTLLAQVGAYKLQDGSTAFPELSDPVAIDGIASVMVEFGRTPDDLTTPQGVMNAVALYRMAEGFKKPTPAPSGSASPGPVAGPSPRPTPAPAAAASLTSDSRGGGAGNSSRPRYNGAHAAVLEAFDKIVKPDDTFNTYGFRKNPRIED